MSAATRLSRRNFLALAGMSGAFVAMPGCTHRSADSDAAVTPEPNLPPFEPGKRSVAATGLPRRIAWANTRDTEFFATLGQGFHQAADARELEYLTANAADDSLRNVSQMRNFLAAGVGAMLVQPLTAQAQEPVMRRALDAGICVQGIITDPCTLQILAPHRKLGLKQGQAAADYIRSRLGGKADVCIFNSDSLSPGTRNFHEGLLDGLKEAGPGVRVVVDTEITRPGIDGISSGYAAMSRIQQQHPDINVVLGFDSFVVGAYRSLQTSGHLHDSMYFGGHDGDASARELVRTGTPFRFVTAFSWGLMGYTLGQYAADWIDGLQVPRALVADAFELTDRASVELYDDVNARPAEVFANHERLISYLPLLGNVGYANRSLTWEGYFEP